MVRLVLFFLTAIPVGRRVEPHIQALSVEYLWPHQKLGHFDTEQCCRPGNSRMGQQLMVHNERNSCTN